MCAIGVESLAKKSERAEKGVGGGWCNSSGAYLGFLRDVDDASLSSQYCTRFSFLKPHSSQNHHDLQDLRATALHDVKHTDSVFRPPPQSDSVDARDADTSRAGAGPAAAAPSTATGGERWLVFAGRLVVLLWWRPRH